MNEKDILEVSHRIEKGIKREVLVLGKTFKIGDLSRKVLNKVIEIQFKVKFYEGEENISSMSKRLKYINNADAKTASYVLLNKWTYIPFLHAIHWRYLNMKYNSEHFNAIIEEGLNNKEYAFSLKNSIASHITIMSRLKMIKGL